MEKVLHQIPVCVVLCIGIVEGPVMEAELVVRAAHFAAVRHPQLRSYIDETSLCFRLIPNCNPCVRIVDATAPDQWQIEAEKECNEGFDMYAVSVLWKLIVVRCADAASGVFHNAVMVKLHHCIGDGCSAMILLNDILGCYVALSRAETPHLKQLPRLPSAAALAFPRVMSTQERATADRMLLKARQRRNTFSPILPLDRHVPASASHHTAIYRDGTAASLAKLVQRCRANHVTVGAVLVAATYFSIARLLREGVGFTFGMHINLRRRLEEVCLYALPPPPPHIRPPPAAGLVCTPRPHLSLPQVLEPTRGAGEAGGTPESRSDARDGRGPENSRNPMV